MADDKRGPPNLKKFLDDLRDRLAAQGYPPPMQQYVLGMMSGVEYLGWTVEERWDAENPSERTEAEAAAELLSRIACDFASKASKIRASLAEHLTPETASSLKIHMDAAFRGAETAQPWKIALRRPLLEPGGSSDDGDAALDRARDDAAERGAPPA